MNKKLVIIACLMFCFLTATYPQQPAGKPDTTAQGINLYNGGDIEGAITVLREAVKKSKKDPRAWHYLGLALSRHGKLKEAQEALEKAIGLREGAIKLEFDRKKGEWRDDELTNLNALLRDQIEAQGKLLEILTDRRALEFEELVLARFRVLAECVDQSSKVVDGHRVLSKGDLMMEKAHVLVKRPPAYPESARKDNVSGTVILRAVFAYDASVQYIELIRSPDSRLTEEAIRAARSIRFRPETICGKPVSYPVQLEYSFNLGG